MVAVGWVSFFTLLIVAFYSVSKKKSKKKKKVMQSKKIANKSGHQLKKGHKEKDEFRSSVVESKNKKEKGRIHPHWVFDEYYNHTTKTKNYRSVHITHNPPKDKNSMKLIKNPNPSDNAASYVVLDIHDKPKDAYRNRDKNLKLYPVDKEKILKEIRKIDK